ncbi:Pyruvate/2-oxoglutarate dehydrogenase complex, dihydrolipoamide acyltransferase (E2) component, and related enzymes [hydrothermal vent metagenome]|uniref:Pyruvate/2-oxoglutarate dehydrogenase complex, dihydrolipoamide acyltransferase (E2) component, and related enzymes n=1 Tax=hydrothermal vent metagenome TaxID=652676 RepID=A0A1W1E5J1_9ZZZZ
MLFFTKIFNFFNKKEANNSLIQIKSSEDLLFKHRKLIDDIYQHTHVPKQHFEDLYLYSIDRLAIWVQDLPASQSHHHSAEGGFLLHTLEVIEIAVKRRNTKMLPIGASVEKQNEKKDLWTFAIFVAALLHDIGKTVSDVNVMVYDHQQKELGRWSPWFGNMSSVDTAKYYQYQYNSNRKYQQHSLLPLTLLSQFINPAAIDWMQNESDLFTLLLMTLQGRSAEGAIIADIIKYADSESSAKSLANSSGNNAGNSNTGNSPQPKSLADKLLDTMRYLVLETDIKINAPGAAMFTTRNDVFFVSKVIMDKIRNSLDENKQKGVPFDNSRMMDELLQFHIITPNSEGKAIWNCTLIGGGFKKPVTLTMLRLPIEKIYFKTENHKELDVFSGEIVIEGEENKGDNKEAASNATATPEVSHSPPIPINDDTSCHQSGNNNATSPANPKPKPNNTTKETPPVEVNLPLPPGFEAATDENTSQNTEQVPPPKVEPTTEETKAEQSSGKPEVLETELGKDFFDWLILTINNKAISINTVESKVHIVMYQGKKALFLISPRIFKEYSAENWARTQKQFGRLRKNLKTAVTEENIWKVKTKTQRIGKQSSIIRGYLIINLEDHNFEELPKANKYLELIITQPKDKDNEHHK